MKRKVGFVGLGNIGMPMAKNLIDDRFDVSVYDVRTEAAQEVAALGATVASSCSELGRHCEVIGVCVRDDADTEAVFLGEDGILAGVDARPNDNASETGNPPPVVAIHSTVRPNTVRTLYADAVASADWPTCAAIESLPSVFGGRLDAATLAELKRDRLQVEAPEALTALEVAEDTLATVQSALHTAADHVEGIGRDLPEPEDGGEVKLGNDGLRELSVSQFQEASAG